MKWGGELEVLTILMGAQNGGGGAGVKSFTLAVLRRCGGGGGVGAQKVSDLRFSHFVAQSSSP